MQKKISFIILVSIFTVSFLILNSKQTHAMCFDACLFGSSIPEERKDNTTFETYFGLGMLNWISGDSIVPPPGFRTNVETYFIKKLYSRLDLGFLKLEFDYMSNKLRYIKDIAYDDNSDLSEAKNIDRLAQQLQLLGGILGYNFIARFRKFNGSIESKGVNGHAQFYYPKNGDPFIIPIGDTIEWSTTLKEFRLEWDTGNMAKRAF